MGMLTGYASSTHSRTWGVGGSFEGMSITCITQDSPRVANEASVSQRSIRSRSIKERERERERDDKGHRNMD